MESFFQTSFADVRIHVGHEAASIGALAFTHGSNIYFAPGMYSPDSAHGQRLLGHELTHVVQQRAGRVRNPFGSGVAVVQDPGLELEADRMGSRAAMAPPPLRVEKPLQPKLQDPKHPSSPAARNLAHSNPAQRLSPEYVLQAPLPEAGGRRQIKATLKGSATVVGSVDVLSNPKGQAWIANLNVSPEHRRRGIGTTLVNAALKTARTFGAASAALEARPGAGSIAPNALNAMYQKLGFQPRGRSSAGSPVLGRHT